MSITPLLEILRSEPMIVSDKNAVHNHVNIITQVEHHIVCYYVGNTEFENIKQDEI